MCAEGQCPPKISKTNFCNSILKLAWVAFKITAALRIPKFPNIALLTAFLHRLFWAFWAATFPFISSNHKNFWKTKIVMLPVNCWYMSIIWLIVTYGCETWAITVTEQNRLLIFERRVLRKIHEPTQDNDGTWRIKTNEELEIIISLLTPEFFFFHFSTPCI